MLWVVCWTHSKPRSQTYCVINEAESENYLTNHFNICIKYSQCIVHDFRWCYTLTTISEFSPYLAVVPILMIWSMGFKFQYQEPSEIWPWVRSALRSFSWAGWPPWNQGDLSWVIRSSMQSQAAPRRKQVSIIWKKDQWSDYKWIRWSIATCR